MHGKIIEGSYASHQVPLPKARSDDVELQALQDWLTSYNPHELFQIKSGVSAKEDWHPVDAILSIIPETESKKLGQKKEAYAGYEPLNVPSWMERGVEKGRQVSCMQEVGGLLKEVIAESVYLARHY